MIELNTNKQGKGPAIKVIGVGGGGNNAINRILENGKPHENVQYVAVNTDEQVLTDSKAQEIVQIGTKLTGGYGAGADPETGEAAARESEDEITDTVTGCDCDVVTVATGMAASMGSFLLASGAPGKRYATPSTEIMIHQPLGGVQGQATDISLVADHIKKVKTKLASIMAEKCKKTLKNITNDMERDHWMTANQAKEYGLVDCVGFPEIV